VEEGGRSGKKRDATKKMMEDGQKNSERISVSKGEERSSTFDESGKASGLDLWVV